MFALADIMTHLEIGVALARKAKRLADAGDAKAEKTKVMSRLFADEVSTLAVRNLQKIVMGTGNFSSEFVSEFMQKISVHELIKSTQNVILDMDKAADILFRR